MSNSTNRTRKYIDFAIAMPKINRLGCAHALLPIFRFCPCVDCHQYFPIFRFSGTHKLACILNRMQNLYSFSRYDALEMSPMCSFFLQFNGQNQAKKNQFSKIAKTHHQIIFLAPNLVQTFLVKSLMFYGLF